MNLRIDLDHDLGRSGLGTEKDQRNRAADDGGGWLSPEETFHACKVILRDVFVT